MSFFKYAQKRERGAQPCPRISVRTRRNYVRPEGEGPSRIIMTFPSRYRRGKSVVVVTIPADGTSQGLVRVVGSQNLPFTDNLAAPIVNTGSGRCLQLVFAAPSVRDDSRKHFLEDVVELGTDFVRFFKKMGYEKKLDIRAMRGGLTLFRWKLRAPTNL